MTVAYRAPLQLHVADDTRFADGPVWAERLHQWFEGNEEVYAVPAPDIPTFVWEGTDGALPPDVEWADAERTALVLLADTLMVGSTDWRGWIAKQAAARRPDDLLLVCAVTKSFGNLGQGIAGLNAIRLFDSPKDAVADDLVLFVTHALARWFVHGPPPSPPIRLFISHAKKAHTVSGRDLAMRLKSFIDARPLGERFFDEVDISGGEEFERRLEASLEDAVVIVLLTDAFSGRFWCGWEVVSSKQKLRPMLVVNALENGEVTSLAYVGKTPTIRWNAETEDSRADPVLHRRIIAAALLEQLRLAHAVRGLEAVRASALSEVANVRVLPRPAELATLPEALLNGDKTLLLHAGPPPPRYEISLMRKHRPDVQMLSATQALSGIGTNQQPLQGRRIAISISDASDREEHGVGKVSQERAFTRIATALLGAGAQLAYGGDLRVGGYALQLMDLSMSLADIGTPLPDGVIHWYAGWPTSENISAEQKADLPAAFRPHWRMRPSEVDPAADPHWPAQDLVPDHHLAWTLGMKDIRAVMAAECDARILLGGQFRAVSPWPGLLEELESFLGKPVYLIGGFGGMTKVLSRVLRGEFPSQLTEEFQDDKGKRTPLRLRYEQYAGAPIGLARRVAKLQEVGIAGLNNGLSVDENHRLFKTGNLMEIITLLLRGLRIKFARKTAVGV